MCTKLIGNISNANQPLRANFNLGHWINIHGGNVGLHNFTINRPPLITLLQIPPPTPRAHPLDVDPVAQIEICTICMKVLACT